MPAAVSSTASRKPSCSPHPRDQPEPQRLVGVDGASGQQQVASVRRADDVGQQPGRGHPRVHAQPHERRREPGGRRRRTGGRTPAPGRAPPRSPGRSRPRSSARRGRGRTARPGRTAASGPAGRPPWRPGSLGDPRGVAPGAERMPAPVTTSTRRSRSAARSVMSPLQASVIGPDMALRWSGWSRVASTTPGARSQDAQVALGHARSLRRKGLGPGSRRLGGAEREISAVSRSAVCRVRGAPAVS